MKTTCEHIYILPTPDKSIGPEYTTKCTKCGKNQLHRNYHSSSSVWTRTKSK